MAIITSKLSCLVTFAVLAILFRPGQAFPGGAPNGACINLIPSAGSHGAGQTNVNPYVLNFSPALNGTVYTPGQTYTVTLQGSNGEEFRGFLVQVRSSPGDAILGGIAENSGDVQLHACMPSDGGVTHTGRTDKPSISFQWTPTAGTGDVVFRYTVVQTQLTHWDAASTDVFQEQVVPTDPPVSTTVDITTMSTTAVDIAPSASSTEAPPQVVMTSSEAGATPAPTNSPMTMCSGGLSLGQWSATWTVKGYYVTFTVSGPSTGGYVAIGFSDSRSMPNSDIVVGGSDGSDSFVSDRYAATRSTPPPDATQDVTNTSVALANNRLSYMFTRRLDTGDAVGDIVLGTRDTMCRYILFASGAVGDIAAQTIMYHGSTSRAVSSERVCLCQSPIDVVATSAPPVPEATSTPSPPEAISTPSPTPSGVGWRATSFSVLVLLIIAAVHCLL